MNKYKIEITKSVEKDLDDLKHLREQAVKELLALENNPQNKSSSLKGNLNGLYSYKFNLPGSGTYRAIYSLQESDEVCLLIIVAPRENIYVKAARRYKILKKQNIIKD